jgi:hypothetical protein
MNLSDVLTTEMLLEAMWIGFAPFVPYLTLIIMFLVAKKLIKSAFSK